MIVAGIDVGSLTAKTVLLDDTKKILASSIVLTRAKSRQAAQDSLDESLKLAGLKLGDISYTLGTGYGRENVPSPNSTLSEITCHARGAHFLIPEVRTVIDIGGQDSKVISIGDRGNVTDFNMNDKCAAGTGRFLDVMAHALEVDLNDMGKLSLQSKKEVQVSSMCTVFAESEVISLIADNCDITDIIAGIHTSIARRVGSMVTRVGVRDKTVMTGGVAKNIGVVRALEKELVTTITVPEEPQIIGALGAALHGLDRAAKEING